MNRADIFKIFDVELNITIFWSTIYFISYMNNVNELLHFSAFYYIIISLRKNKNSKIKICDKDRIERDTGEKK